MLRRLQWCCGRRSMSVSVLVLYAWLLFLFHHFDLNRFPDEAEILRNAREPEINEMQIQNDSRREVPDRNYVAEDGADRLDPDQIVRNWKILMRGVLPNDTFKYFGSEHIAETNVDTVLSRLVNTQRMLTYEPFSLLLPNFISDYDKDAFIQNNDNSAILGIQPQEKLIGKVNVLPDVTFSAQTDCGFRTKDTDFIKDMHSVGHIYTRKDGILVPLLVPDSFAFQHFIDGVLPKIMQALDFILLPGVKLLLMKPRDVIIFEMLDRLGIGTDKIVLYQHNTVKVQTIINTCVTPPLHPLLWNTARSLLGVPKNFPSPDDGLVIMVTRAGSHNHGRHMLNTDAVQKLLEDRYPGRLTLFKGSYNLKQTIALFSRARIIIGVHGGAFYNMFFASSQTHVIEFMPITSQRQPVNGIAHQIFWMQANLIGQPFWRINIEADRNLDVTIPITQLTKVLDKIDEKHK